MTPENNEPKSIDTQALALLGVTSAAWAHRLSNSLGIIPVLIRRIENRLEDKELDDKGQVLSDLNRIEAAVGEQLDIARELSGFARLSAGSGVGPTPVNSVVRKTWEEYYKPSEKTPNATTFQFDLSSNLPDATADEKLLGEVIRNLVDNSIRAVHDRVIGIICIKTHQISGNIVIDISDNGTGIPPALAEKLFQKATPAGKTEGLGIGLLIAQTLVNSWGGRLSLVKSDMAGTTIRATLMKWKTAPSVRMARRGLVVEDDVGWKHFIVDSLLERGLSVDVATSLVEAIRPIETNEYDLALLDLRLTNDLDAADVSGLNVARLLRERNPEALIVIMTGFAGVSVVRDAFRAGVDEVLDKSSFSMDEFNRILDKAAVRRETERESIRQSQLNRLMYEILSMISHELRAPLLTVQRNAEALVIGALGPLTEEQIEAVETIRSATTREFVLLNAHLDLNRIEEGVERLNYQEYDLIALVREEIAAHKPEADRKGVELRVQLPKQEAVVNIDVNRFRVALNPLMDNAIKFSPKRGEVVVRARLTAKYVEVDVSDQGPGIKPDELERLMNWRATKPASLTQRIRSSGLGLSMAKRMIELHSGKLWIESDGKSGTTVSFRLPIR